MKTYKIDNQYGPLEERVKNLEDYLQRKFWRILQLLHLFTYLLAPLPLPEGILERIKALEDRALALERGIRRR